MSDENKKEMAKLHNSLLKIENILLNINRNNLDQSSKQNILYFETIISDEIDRIRHELKINTCTIIDEKDLNINN